MWDTQNSDRLCWTHSLVGQGGGAGKARGGGCASICATAPGTRAGAVVFRSAFGVRGPAWPTLDRARVPSSAVMESRRSAADRDTMAEDQASHRPAIRTATYLPEHAYLHIALRFGIKGRSDDAHGALDSRVYKSVILAAARELYGDVGLGGEIDVLDVLVDGSALVRVCSLNLSTRNQAVDSDSRQCAGGSDTDASPIPGSVQVSFRSMGRHHADHCCGSKNVQV